MIALLVIFIMGAVVWFFGTLPWLVINGFLCDRPTPSVACAYPETYGEIANQIVIADVIVVICVVVAIAQIRKLRRARRQAK